MRYQSLVPFLLAGVAALPLVGQTNQTKAVKRSNPTEAKSRAPMSGTRTAAPGISESRKSRLVKMYARQPMRFEANEGQTDANVKFLARGAGYRLFLTADEAIIAMRRPPSVTPSITTSVHSPASTAMRLRFLGANATTAVVGIEKLPGQSNYFVGNDPKQWRTQVPAYAKVRYEGIYPGIDLIYHGNPSQLEYDLVAAPGADVSVITMEATGLPANVKKNEIGNELRARIDSRGNLILDVEDGRLVLHKPVAYQATDPGVRVGRAYVDTRYVIKGTNQVGFEVGSHDSRKALIIDPILSYSTYLGGSQDDLGNAITVDTSGSAYVTGGTTSSNFPVTSGVVQTTYGGADGGYQSVNGDIFVTKLSPDGSSLVWSTYIGGSGDDNAYSIAVDGTGVYLTGGTNSSDYPVTPGVYRPTSGVGLTDVLVTKLDPTGSTLLYSTHVGVAVEGIRGFGIAVDAAGNAYVAGGAGPGFPTTAGAYQTSSSAFSSAFAMKLSPDGSAADYSTFLSGGNSSDVDYAESIAVDKNGNAYITGYAGSSTFPVTTGAFQSNNAGSHDAFFTLLNSSGSALLYSTYLGGAGNDEGFRIAVDSAGMAYIAGMTASSNFPTSTGAFQTAYGGGASDAFIAKLDPTKSGSASLVYATYLGGSGDDNLIAFPWGILAVDSLGHAYVTGGTTSTDFPTVHPVQAHSGGGYDAYVAKLNTTGTALLYSTYLGGSGDDIGRGIAVDSNGNAYVTGQTSSSDFSVTANPYQKVLGGASDAFVSKLVPIAFATPTSLTFASQPVGTTSAAQTFTLTNEQITSLSIAFTMAGDFGETDTCGSSLGPDLSCTISVIFKPTGAGSRTGSVTIPGAPQSVSIVGTGTDFSIAAASGANCPSGGNCSTSAAIKAGQTASYNLQVTPKSGFSGTVALTCAGAPMSATCSVSPASVAVNGATGSAFVVSLSNTSSAQVIPFVRPHGSPVEFGALMLPYLLAPLLIARRRLASKRLGLATAPVCLLLVFTATLLIMTGCGGGSAPPTNTTLTITGTSSGVSRTLPINLTVNH
ncbi:MAG TPA: SBBP repeat-containing protein [Candidatus Sulfotelmatobacter sp.]|nr:SBBP repeat-containing protein [Candidatus Sulfotelmatobacter sp.]